MNTNETIKGILFGAVGGAVGTLSMSYYWKAAEKLHGHDPRMLTREGQHELDDISAVGQQAREDEASTEAVGRILHKKATGRQPTKKRKASLSEGVHWSYGILVSALYGAIRTSKGIPDAPGGAVFGTALWAFGDELAVPLLGLSKGPTAYPMEQHAHRLGAHLFYGLIAAATTQSLFQAFSPAPKKRTMAWNALKTYVTFKGMKAAMDAASDVGQKATRMIARRRSHGIQDMLRRSADRITHVSMNGGMRSATRNMRDMMRRLPDVIS
ncbi:MAG TPA: hypothetical protein VF190_06085 [Rhodothermales bacterium]